MDIFQGKSAPFVEGFYMDTVKEFVTCVFIVESRKVRATMNETGCYLTKEQVIVILDRLETMLEVFMVHVAQFNAGEFQRFLDAKNRIHQILSNGMTQGGH